MAHSGLVARAESVPQITLNTVTGYPVGTPTYSLNTHAPDQAALTASMAPLRLRPHRSGCYYPNSQPIFMSFRGPTAHHDRAEKPALRYKNLSSRDKSLALTEPCDRTRFRCILLLVSLYWLIGQAGNRRFYCSVNPASLSDAVHPEPVARRPFDSAIGNKV